jgi:hypothetical protein
LIPGVIVFLSTKRSPLGLHEAVEAVSHR